MFGAHLKYLGLNEACPLRLLHFSVYVVTVVILLGHTSQMVSEYVATAA